MNYAVMIVFVVAIFAMFFAIFSVVIKMGFILITILSFMFIVWDILQDGTML